MTTETTKMLMDEHQNILIVVDSLERECKKIGPGTTLDEPFFRKTIDFIRNYADGFHHAKEEDILFKEFTKLAEGGETHCDPTQQMLYEHDQGRDFVKGMETALGIPDAKGVVQNARGYIALIRDHIFKEDNILYPMADEAISTKVQKSMLEKFKRISKQKESDEKKYLAIVSEFKNRK